ncbi:MAG: hypothetical protein ACR2O3_15500 [Rhizobiaceae bacterium]
MAPDANNLLNVLRSIASVFSVRRFRQYYTQCTHLSQIRGQFDDVAYWHIGDYRMTHLNDVQGIEAAIE